MSDSVAMLTFPYEYVSGVGRMNLGGGPEFYLANRAATAAVGRVLLMQAPDIGDAPNDVVFDSGNQTVPGQSFRLIQWGGNDNPGYSLYWARIFTTSRDLVPSLRFWVQENGATSVDLTCAPGDFAVFSPSNEPVLSVPIGPNR